MRYMNWSVDEYESAPLSVVERIIETMVDDAERRRQQERRAAMKRR